MEQPVYKAQQVLKVLPAQRVHKVLLVLWVLRVLPELKVLPAQQVHKALLVL
jgi:hypothetical protein